MGTSHLVVFVRYIVSPSNYGGDWSRRGTVGSDCEPRRRWPRKNLHGVRRRAMRRPAKMSRAVTSAGRATMMMTITTVARANGARAFCQISLTSDQITPPPLAEAMARGIPGATLVVVPGAGQAWVPRIKQRHGGPWRCGVNFHRATPVPVPPCGTIPGVHVPAGGHAPVRYFTPCINLLIRGEIISSTMPEPSSR